MHHDTSPIAAIATPPGEGGIAVIRVSGSGAIEAVARIFQGKNLTKQASHTAHFGRVVRKGIIQGENHGEIYGEIIDEVIATIFRSPRSFTGEDTVEISCHGGVLNTQTVLETVLATGVRMAEPGEFTLRAFLNGKMELSQAEAVADMIHAKSRKALQAAQQQLEGAIGKLISSFRQAIIDATAMLELELDFIEEDVTFADRTQLRKLLTELEVQLRQLLESYETGRLLRDGVRTVLIGKPNAGKSTLLNRLIGRDRAIVSEVAGTTRDTIEADWTYRGVYFRLIDTAGLRETEDVIEAEGVRRTRKAIEEADVVMILDDLREPGSEELRKVILRTFPDKPLLFIGNKVDTIDDPEFFSSYDLLISASENQGIDTLKSQLLEKALGRVDTDAASLVITSTRHRDALEKALNFVNSALQRLEDGSSNEFLSIDLRSALQELGHITGEITNEDILDSIFSRFCIGK